MTKQLRQWLADLTPAQRDHILYKLLDDECILGSDQQVDFREADPAQGLEAELYCPHTGDPLLAGFVEPEAVPKKELSCCFCHKQMTSLEGLQQHSAKCMTHPVRAALANTDAVPEAFRRAQQQQLQYLMATLPNNSLISIEITNTAFRMQLFDCEYEDFCLEEPLPPTNPAFDFKSELQRFVNEARSADEKPPVTFPDMRSTLQLA